MTAPDGSADTPETTNQGQGKRTDRPRWLRLTPFLGRPPALTRHQWRVLGLVGTASLFETYDLALFSLTLKQIQVDLTIPEASLGIMVSIIRLGAIPAFVVALAADRFGRRRVLLSTILIYTLLTGATALAPDTQTFVVLQFLARTFAVAEALLAVVVIAEEFDPHVRGWGIGALLAIKACGTGLAALLFAWVEYFPFGWRSLYLAGLGPLLLLAYWRRNLPETSRFAAHRAAAQTRANALQPLFALLRMYPGRLAAVAAVVFVTELAETSGGVFGPKYLQDAHGWTPADISTMIIIGGGLAIIASTLVGGLSDRWGRRRMTSGMITGQVVFTLAYYSARGLLLMPLWIAMSFVSVGANVTLAAYGAELFPTSYRSTATGMRVVIGTLGGSLGLLLESYLYGIVGSHWTAIRLLAATAVIAPFIIAATYPETAGRNLEDIAPERSG